MNADDLIKQLDARRRAYEDTLRQFQEALGQTFVLPSLPEPHYGPSSPRSASQPSLVFSESDSRKRDTDSRRKQSYPLKSTLSISDDSDDESDLSLYVQTPLPARSCELGDLQKHIKSYKFDEYGRKILGDVESGPWTFPGPNDSTDKTTEYSQFQVFDVGSDGAPLPVELHTLRGRRGIGKEMAIWHTFKDLNNDPNKERKAVGRITIAREPSKIMFAALHHTYNSAFDMDDLFKHLVESEASSADMDRSFHEDPRRQRSFVFNFEYYTIVGDECVPMSWQLADKQLEASEGHIPVSRCSSVVALSLSGEPIKKVRNPARRAKTKHGYVYDPWASWEVINLQAYPDWQSSTDGHDSSKHYVNGPEAFLHVLLTEFKDAQKRYEIIYKRITKMVTPPPTFIFDPSLREKLLFEDDEFTYSKRYFWAYQTLGTMNDSIKALVDSYEDTFTESVWTGTHKTIWPQVEETSARSVYWKKRMQALKRQFEAEIRNLRTLIRENNERRHEIRSLRDQLFSGTSVLESRKSVEQAEITVQQNYNIKVLTLVNIFFLPLTFVTSVFGMTNMPTEHHFWMFGIVVCAVCVPFFLLIGSLNTDSGYHFWKHKVYVCLSIPQRAFLFLTGDKGRSVATADQDGKESMDERAKSTARASSMSLSAKEGIAERQRGNQYWSLLSKSTSIDSKNVKSATARNSEDAGVRDQGVEDHKGEAEAPSRIRARADAFEEETATEHRVKKAEDHVTVLDRLMRRNRSRGLDDSEEV